MHTTTLFFSYALALVAASPQFPFQPNVADLLTTPRPPYIPVLSRNEVRDDSGQVISTYQSADGTSFEQVDVLKPSHDPKKPKVLVQQGTYSYIAPDGTPVQVSYIADEKGFRPVGTHILGEVPVVPDVPVVEPPPVPAPQPLPVRATVPEPFPVSFPAPPPAPRPVSFPAPPPVPAPTPLPVSFPNPLQVPAPQPFPASAPVPVATNSEVPTAPVISFPSVPGASFNQFTSVPGASYNPFPSVPGAPGGTFVPSPASPSGYTRLF